MFQEKICLQDHATGHTTPRNSGTNSPQASGGTTSPQATGGAVSPQDPVSLYSHAIFIFYNGTDIACLYNQMLSSSTCLW